MKLKPIIAIIVLSLVVASLLVSGCSQTTTQSSPTASQQVEVTATPTATASAVSAIQVTSTEKTGAGYRYVAFNITTKDDQNWRLEDAAGNIYGSYLVSQVLDPNTNTPLSAYSEFLYLKFPVPQTAKLTKLTYKNETILDETQLT